MTRGDQAKAKAEARAIAIQRLERRVGAHAGLRPPAWVIASRARDRMRALGLAELSAYATLVEEDAGELRALTECLRVGETRFFRHRAHVAAVRRVVIPDLAARLADARRVRAWSAGCASGEETWTLAMLLDEGLPAERGWKVEVVGTDISDEALTAARRGVYAKSSVAEVPRELRARWFAPVDEARVRVVASPPVRVRFDRHNLIDPIHLRRVDVIFCRNVLIYFDPEARARTIAALIDALAPGGYLFVGYSESLREFASLEALRTDDGIVCRKRPLAAGSTNPMPVPAPIPVSVPVPDPRPRAPEPPSSRPRDLPNPRRPDLLVLRGVFDDPSSLAALLRDAIAAAAGPLLVDLDAVEFLSDAAASILRRARAAGVAAGHPLLLRATRPGPRRWLVRHGLLDDEGSPP
jgi:chemotaxis protein methyltransferase CheR